MINYAHLLELLEHAAVSGFHIHTQKEGHTVVVVVNRKAGYRAGKYSLCTTRDPNRIRLWRDIRRCTNHLEQLAPSIPVTLIK